MRGQALTEVCVVLVAGSTEREAISFRLELLAFVPGLKQLTNSRLLLLSLPPFLSTVPSVSCFQFFSPFLMFNPLLLSPSSSSRGSPWQSAGAAGRKWVSGSFQAAGAGRLCSQCNLSTVTPSEPLCTRELLHSINTLHPILLCSPIIHLNAH